MSEPLLESVSVTPPLQGRRARKRLFFLLALLLLVTLSLVAAWFLGILRQANPRMGKALKPEMVLTHPEVDEASGLVQSRTDPNVLWLHNDSGDRPRIFAITPQGDMILPPEQANNGMVTTPPPPDSQQRLYPGISVGNASLVDWEDVAVHGNRLFLAEMGNNLNQRQNLGVYELEEPDPRKVDAVQAKAFYPIRYPDQTEFPPTDGWNFDCEAMFWWGGHLYFVSKTRPAFRVYVQGEHAALYRLDSWHTDQPNVLTRVDQVDGLGGWVTAADANQEGRFIALLIESPVQSVWVFERPLQGDRFFSAATSVRRLVFHDGGQLESLAFFRRDDGEDDILLLNEQREIFRLPLDSIPELKGQRK